MYLVVVIVVSRLGLWNLLISFEGIVNGMCRRKLILHYQQLGCLLSSIVMYWICLRLIWCTTLHVQVQTYSGKILYELELANSVFILIENVRRLKSSNNVNERFFYNSDMIMNIMGIGCKRRATVISISALINLNRDLIVLLLHCNAIRVHIQHIAIKIFFLLISIQVCNDNSRNSTRSIS